MRTNAVLGVLSCLLKLFSSHLSCHIILFLARQHVHCLVCICFVPDCTSPVAPSSPSLIAPLLSLDVKLMSSSSSAGLDTCAHTHTHTHTHLCPCLALSWPLSPTRAKPLSVCSVRPIETHAQGDKAKLFKQCRVVDPRSSGRPGRLVTTHCNQQGAGGVGCGNGCVL